MATASNKITSLLGKDADSLLSHKAKVPANLLQLPGPDFIDRVWMQTDRNPQVLVNLQRMFGTGRLANTGYLSILPVDQGIEHAAGASFAKNPIYFDGENIVKLAIEGGCNAVATTFGVLGSVSRKYAHRIPFLVKINHNELLTMPNKFDQIMFGTVREAWNLGAAAVGATIYFGSPNSDRQIIEVARAFEGRGLAFVDSPVAGSVASVLNSALLVMASGPEDAVRRATTIFGAFAREVVFLGAAGSGQAMKLCAGLVVHTLNSAVAEGLALATRAGIDPALAYDVFAGSSVGAPYLTYKREVFLGTDAPVAMALDLSGKDLALILDYARDRGLTLPVLSGVVDEVSAARARGYGSSDMADVVRFVLGEDAPARPHP